MTLVSTGLIFTDGVTYFSAKEFIQDFEGDEPDIVVYQVTCNDIEKQANSETLSQLDDLVNTTKNKFCAKKSKVLISLPLPRKEKKLIVRFT